MMRQIKLECLYLTIFLRLVKYLREIFQWNTSAYSSTASVIKKSFIPLTTVGKVIKLYFVTDDETNEASVIVSGKFPQPSLIFARYFQKKISEKLARNFPAGYFCLFVYSISN